MDTTWCEQHNQPLAVCFGLIPNSPKEDNDEQELHS